MSSITFGACLNRLSVVRNSYFRRITQGMKLTRSKFLSVWNSLSALVDFVDRVTKLFVKSEIVLFLVDESFLRAFGRCLSIS